MQVGEGTVSGLNFLLQVSLLFHPPSFPPALPGSVSGGGGGGQAAVSNLS